ncbi:putative endonuclease [Pseudomonas phage PPpW-3]|uniref:Putative endonuclease n=1 Tax=Pseudomonas phage PPpW-3 TaxID=1279082 RepID=V5YTE7_9CAUD|nr:HNH endonuclease [Pseudomonas phage PPpW-3]BAO20652.1 putative endonuclease [Pseudomonas phage PPpW-3]
MAVYLGKRENHFIEANNALEGKTMTKEELAAILRYDSKTGVFYWLKSRGRAASGSIAGGDDGKGYVGIRINGKQYKAHKLAWLACTGEWPSFQIDHRDTDRSNNRFENLRPSTQLQNTYNRSLGVNNKSGVKGVHWHKNSGKWRAVIGVNGKKIYIGIFDDINDAQMAISQARTKHHQEFSRPQ